MNHLHKIDPVDLGLLMLGTLLFNGEGQLEPVKSLSYSSYGKDVFRQTELFGEINGRPVFEFFHVPVTIDLLTALEWTFENDKKGQIITAWPASYQFMPASDSQEFPVKFILADRALEDWFSGTVVAQNGGGDWIEVTNFLTLERLFLEMYGQRMDIRLSPQITSGGQNHQFSLPGADSHR